MAFTYIRAVPHLSPVEPLSLDTFTLRHYTRAEAEAMNRALRKRNTFARHQPERDTYTPKTSRLADNSVLHAISDAGARDVESVRREADAVEELLIISTAFAQSRSWLHRFIVASPLRESATDLWINHNSGKLSTRTRNSSISEPIRVDSTLINRYRRLGFSTVVRISANDSFVGARLRLVSNWLLASRLDSDTGSAFIKTGTAGESLIAGDASGGVTRRLSRRVATLVADSQANWEYVRLAMVALYGVRCDFAHGRHSGAPTGEQRRQLEAFDRLVALGLASFAASCGTLTSPVQVDQWFASATVPLTHRPFSPAVVQRALAFA